MTKEKNKSNKISSKKTRTHTHIKNAAKRIGSVTRKKKERQKHKSMKRSPEQERIKQKGKEQQAHKEWSRGAALKKNEEKTPARK